MYAPAAAGGVFIALFGRYDAVADRQASQDDESGPEGLYPVQYQRVHLL